MSNWHVVSVSPCYDEHGVYCGWRKQIEWCRDQFDEYMGICWGYDMEGIFRFENERDATMFLLRWS
jgi:hypothetical protein